MPAVKVVFSDHRCYLMKWKIIQYNKIQYKLWKKKKFLYNIHIYFYQRYYITVESWKFDGIFRLGGGGLARKNNDHYDIFTLINLWEVCLECFTPNWWMTPNLSSSTRSKLKEDVIYTIQSQEIKRQQKPFIELQNYTRSLYRFPQANERRGWFDWDWDWDWIRFDLFNNWWVV